MSEQHSKFGVQCSKRTKKTLHPPAEGSQRTWHCMCHNQVTATAIGDNSSDTRNAGTDLNLGSHQTMPSVPKREGFRRKAFTEHLSVLLPSESTVVTYSFSVSWYSDSQLLACFLTAHIARFISCCTQPHIRLEKTTRKERES